MSNNKRQDLVPVKRVRKASDRPPRSQHQATSASKERRLRANMRGYDSNHQSLRQQQTMMLLGDKCKLRQASQRDKSMRVQGGIAPKNTDDQPTVTDCIKVNSNSASINYSCFACDQTIQDKYILSACNKFWHENCLKCDRCQERLVDLGSSLYEKSSMKLCRQDYHDLFGQRAICSVCDKLIFASELVMRAKSNVYHLECFACQLCGLRFCVGDRFYLCENKIVCQYDYDEHIVPIQKSFYVPMESEFFQQQSDQWLGCIPTSEQRGSQHEIQEHYPEQTNQPSEKLAKVENYDAVSTSQEISNEDKNDVTAMKDCKNGGNDGQEFILHCNEDLKEPPEQNQADQAENKSD